MTAYNREKFIGKAIESVLNSTYSNFELIIVDDCSTDRTVEIAESFVINDARVRLFINESNLGDYPNRNKAASYANGVYLKYVDADDLIYPFGLAQLVCYMERFPLAGYGLCSLSQDEHEPFPFQLSPEEAYRRHYFGKPIFHKAPLSSIIRKECFNAVGGFIHKRMVGDFDMWHRLSQIFPVVLMHHGIVWYRKHQVQEMSRYNDFIIDYISVSETMLRADQCPLNHIELPLALKRLRNYKLSMLLRYSNKLRFRECVRLIKALS